MWRRACMCGCPWAVHGHRWRDDTRCGGCPCIYYQPRRRRWLRAGAA